MRRLMLFILCVFLCAGLRAANLTSDDKRVAILNDPSSPVTVTDVSSSPVAEDGSTRVVLTVKANDDVGKKAAILVSTFSSEGECRKKIAFIRQISATRESENWTVRLVGRDAGDVTVISTVSADKLAEKAPLLAEGTKEIVGRLVNKDMRKMSGQCRLECRDFGYACVANCNESSQNACVCCRPVGGPNTGPCDFMECTCVPGGVPCPVCTQ